MSGSAKCYVGGLSWNTNDDMLREVFEKFGALVECKVIMDRGKKCIVDKEEEGGGI